MTLYEIDDLIQSALFFEDEETGEVTVVNPETGEMLSMEEFNALPMERNQKIENLLMVCKRYEAEIKAGKEEKARIDEYIKKKTAELERVKNYASFVLNGEKFESAKAKASWRKSTKVIVEDMDTLPEEYIRVRTTREPDRTALKDAMKRGEVFLGAHIEETKSLTIK